MMSLACLLDSVGSAVAVWSSAMPRKERKQEIANEVRVPNSCQPSRILRGEVMTKQFYIGEALAMASEVRYQTPLIKVEWRQKECQCGARARFPGPCVDCASHRLASRVGEDLARRWVEACKEQQLIWKLISDAAAVSAKKSLGPYQDVGYSRLSAL